MPRKGLRQTLKFTRGASGPFRTKKGRTNPSVHRLPETQRHHDQKPVPAATHQRVTRQTSRGRHLHIDRYQGSLPQITNRTREKNGRQRSEQDMDFSNTSSCRLDSPMRQPPGKSSSTTYSGSSWTSPSSSTSTTSSSSHTTRKTM